MYLCDFEKEENILEKENILFTSIFSFSHYVYKILLL